MYFQQVLNVEDTRAMKTSAVDDRKLLVLDELNDSVASVKDVFWAFIDLEKACGMTWYVADAKSAWSGMEIVECSAEFLSR